MAHGRHYCNTSREALKLINILLLTEVLLCTNNHQVASVREVQPMKRPLGS